MKPSIYLDFAAATPLDKEVLRAMQSHLTDDFYNPSATYNGGRAARKSLEDARTLVAQIIGAKAGEITFTAGGTEANNLAISGVMNKYPGSNMLVSAIEHPSVLEPASQFNHKIVPVNSEGVIDVSKIMEQVNDQTVLISLMLVNHELGSLQPVKELAQLIKQVVKSRRQASNDLPLLLHSDAAQAANTLDLHVARLGVDLMSLNGGKIYGPKQTGILFIKAPNILQPIILGGGQEYGLRSGTENVAGAVGLALALKKSQAKYRAEQIRLGGIRKYFIDQINDKLPSAAVNGPLKTVSPHLLNVSFKGEDNERLMMQLDEGGIMVAVGSACSASKDQPSPVLAAIGLKPSQISSSLRFSFGRPTTKSEIDTTISRLAGFLKPA